MICLDPVSLAPLYVYGRNHRSTACAADAREASFEAWTPASLPTTPVSPVACSITSSLPSQVNSQRPITATATAANSSLRP